MVAQNKTEITKVLSARGLDARFADLIEIGDDVEEAQARIDSLDKLFKLAVRGMLPKTKLGREMIKKLKVYAGSEHPHTAQIAKKEGK